MWWQWRVIGLNIFFTLFFTFLHDDGLRYVNVDHVDVLPITNLPDWGWTYRARNALLPKLII